jgi:hypothetical protein
MEYEIIDKTMRVAVEIKIASDDTRYGWTVTALGRIIGLGGCDSRAEAIEEAKAAIRVYSVKKVKA